MRDRTGPPLASSSASSVMATFFRFSFLVFALLVLVHAEDNLPVPTATPKLLFVAELCRHGDRTPLAEFPSDALPVSRWPEGVGQLTAIGQRAHYDLGKRLRDRYVETGFLSSSYSAREIYVRSTDVDRTLMSAHSQLAGLFPPGSASNYDVRVKFGKDALHENEGGLPHLFQPVPIHTESKTNDMVLLPGANCPRHVQLMHQKRLSDEFIEKTNQEADFLKAAGRIAQVDDPDSFTIFDLEKLSDTWTCFAAHSVPLPDAATPDIVSRARNLSNWLVTFGNTGLEVNRLRAGLVLNTVREYMAMAELEEESQLPVTLKGKVRKFLLLSAHDTTVAATLAALRVFNNEFPPYNSTIIWELYKASNGTYFVRVEFNGEQLLLPDCPSIDCSTHDYMTSTRQATIFSQDEREVECLTGFRRFASSIGSVFPRKKTSGTEKAQLEGFGSMPQDTKSSNLASGYMFFIVLACIVGAVGFLSACRARARYSGYTRTDDDYSDELSKSDTDPLTRKKILM